MVRLIASVLVLSAAAVGLLLSAGLVVAPLERTWKTDRFPIAIREPLSFHRDCPPIQTEPVVVGFCELMRKRGCYDGRRVTVRAEFSRYFADSGYLKDRRCQSEVIELESPSGGPLSREVGEYAFVRVPEVAYRPEWLLWRPIPTPHKAAATGRFNGWPLRNVIGTFTGLFIHRESRLIAFRHYPGAKVHARLFEELTLDAFRLESAEGPELIGSSPRRARYKAEPPPLVP